MTLQNKILLGVLPPIVLSLLALGTLNYIKTAEEVRRSTYLYINTLLHTFIQNEVKQRQALLHKSGLDNIASFVSRYQKEVMHEARRILDKSSVELCIFGSHGKILFKSEGFTLNLPPDFIPQLFLQLQQQNNGIIDEKSDSQQGEKHQLIYTAYYYPPWEWGFLLYEPDTVLRQTFREMQWQTFGVIGTVTALLVSLIVFISRRFIQKPLAMLSQSAQQIGNLQAIGHIPVLSEDELGLLARHMEKMSAALQGYRNKQLLWQNELEREVALRTDELHESNRQLRAEAVTRMEAEKKLEEQRYYLQSIIDSMPSILIAIDRQERIIHWNHEAETFSGLLRSQAEYKELYDVLPFLSPHAGSIRQVLSSQQPHKLTKQHITPGKNEDFYADIMIYPLIAKSSQGAVLRLDNITERVRLEEIMVRTEKMLSVGGLAAGMAHEINNPLGGMLQALQNVQRRLSGELEQNHETAKHLNLDFDKLQAYLEQRDIPKFLTHIQQAGQRAAAIVSNMLQFSRKENTVKHTENLSGLIDSALELAAVDYDLKKQYDFRSIRIQCDYAPEPLFIPCVTGEIQQVLLNILRNAAQALHQSGKARNGAEIVIRTRRQKDWARIEIQDNGPGMEESVRRHIFEPFFTTKEPGIGTGLGLAVSYFIICEEHDGEFNVTSQPGKGSNFILRLPLKQQ